MPLLLRFIMPKASMNPAGSRTWRGPRPRWCPRAQVLLPCFYGVAGAARMGRGVPPASDEPPRTRKDPGRSARSRNAPPRAPRPYSMPLGPRSTLDLPQVAHWNPSMANCRCKCPDRILLECAKASGEFAWRSCRGYGATAGKRAPKSYMLIPGTFLAERGGEIGYIRLRELLRR